MSAKITVSLAPGLLVRELEEGYAALAELNRTDAEQFLGAQAEAVSKDGN